MGVYHVIRKACRHTLRALFLLFVIGSSALSLAEIYKWVDAAGKVHFSDSKPQEFVTESIDLNINSYKDVSYKYIVPEEVDSTSYSNNKSVVMYATSWCGYCKKARQYFVQNNIQFSEYDIEKDSSAKQRYDAYGGRGVPVILVGEQMMSGFSTAGFEAIYKK